MRLFKNIDWYAVSAAWGAISPTGGVFYSPDGAVYGPDGRMLQAPHTPSAPLRTHRPAVAR